MDMLNMFTRVILVQHDAHRIRPRMSIYAGHLKKLRSVASPRIYGMPWLYSATMPHLAWLGSPHVFILSIWPLAGLGKYNLRHTYPEHCGVPDTLCVR